MYQGSTLWPVGSPMRPAFTQWRLNFTPGHQPGPQDRWLSSLGKHTLIRASDILQKKEQNFAGFSRANSRKNRPISRDFHGRKVKIHRKIGRFRGILTGEKSKIAEKSGRFRGILAEQSQISRNFQGQIVRKIGRSHGKFRGKLRQETIGKKQPISLDFFWQISLKSINFASIWPALFNVFLTGIIMCSFNNSSLEKWANAKAINIMVIAQFFAMFIEDAW